jgi:hypothetical protein
MKNQNHIGFLKVDRVGHAQVLGNSLRKKMSHQVGYYTLDQFEDDRLTFKRVEQVPTWSELREPIVFQGDLAGIGSSIELISFISQSSLSGQLTCVKGDIRKSLFFKEGELCAARSNHIEDRLAEVIIKYGGLDRDTLKHLEASAQAERKPLGNELIAKGLLSQQQLFELFKKQVEDIFFSLLLWEQGDFYFTVPHQRIPTPLQLSTQQLLLEGVRRTDEMRRFRERITSHACMIQKIPEVEVSSNQLKHIVEHLEQAQSIQRLLDLTCIGEFELYRNVFRLLELNVVEIIYQEDMSDHLSLGDLIALYNNAFHLMQQFARATEAEIEPLQKGLEVFLQFYPQTEIFDQLNYDDKGRLDSAHLLENIKQHHEEYTLPLLGHALSELLFFQLFAARSWLSEMQKQQLQELYDELSLLVLRSEI